MNRFLKIVDVWQHLLVWFTAGFTLFHLTKITFNVLVDVMTTCTYCKLIFMIEHNYFQHKFSHHAYFLLSCLSESFLSEIPVKKSESLLSDLLFVKLIRPHVFDINVVHVC